MTSKKVNQWNEKKGLVMCTEEYCKWQINAPYNINRNNEMTVGPFPGDLAKTSFMSFDYKAIDVLCLEKMIVSGNGMTIDILEVKLRSTKIYSQKNSLSDKNFDLP